MSEFGEFYSTCLTGAGQIPHVDLNAPWYLFGQDVVFTGQLLPWVHITEGYEGSFLYDKPGRLNAQHVRLFIASH